jgi:signal transduction histidine kinase
LTIDCEPHQAIFRVQDQGIGIPEDDQKRLFETFHRASNVRQIPGTGLGLAIAKQSVELHGGMISFESQAGVGTTFTVVLPQAGQTASEHSTE